MNVGALLVSGIWLAILVYIFPLIQETLNLETYLADNVILQIGIIMLFFFPMAILINGAFGGEQRLAFGMTPPPGGGGFQGGSF